MFILAIFGLMMAASALSTITLVFERRPVLASACFVLFLASLSMAVVVASESLKYPPARMIFRAVLSFFA